MTPGENWCPLVVPYQYKRPRRLVFIEYIYWCALFVINIHNTYGAVCYMFIYFFKFINLKKKKQFHKNGNFFKKNIKNIVFFRKCWLFWRFSHTNHVLYTKNKMTKNALPHFSFFFQLGKTEKYDFFVSGAPRLLWKTVFWGSTTKKKPV